MAKKEKLELEQFKLDDELNFDFDIDAFDNKFAIGEGNKDPRKPSVDIVKGTIEGAASTFKSPAFISKTIRDSLPEHYGEIFKTADQTTASLVSLYDDTIKEVKPQLSRLAKKVDRLVPEESKFFKRLSEKFSELMGDEASGYGKVSSEQLQEQGVANALAGVFGAQQEIDNEEKAKVASENRIEKAIDQKRFTSQLSVLNNIDQNISRLTQYNEKINQAFQKKSLELQYRSFFTQTETLGQMKNYFEVFKVQNEAIVKNTALPEFVKIKDSERFKERAKNAFIDGMQRGLFGSSNIVETAGKRLRGKLTEKVNQFKEGMEMGMMGLDSAEMMMEQQKMLAESGIETDSKSRMLGAALGTGGANELGRRLSSKIREQLPEDSPIGRFGYKAADAIQNLPGYVEKARQSDWLRDNEYADGVEGMKARTASFFLDLFRPEDPEMRVRDGGSLKELNDPAAGFTNKALRSVTDVIPGYLARIYREVTMFRTQSTDVPLTMYDFGKGEFTSKGKIASDISRLLKSKASNADYNRTVDNAVKTFVGDAEVTEDERTRLKNFMLQLSKEDGLTTADGIRQSKAYQKSTITPLIDNLLDRNIEGSANKEKSEFQLGRSIKGIRKETPDIRADVEARVNAGYGDILEEQGIIRKGSDGEIDIDFEMYNRMIRDQTMGTSDVNVKRNITAMNPKDALSAVKQTKVYDWFYKAGKGDQEPHTGPMAQDIQRNIGDEAAPGGKKIDLINMNGVNMAAIQALETQQQKLMKSDTSGKFLEGIKKDTGQIIRLMRKGGGGTGGGGSASIDPTNLKEILEARKGFYSSVVEPTIKGAFEGITSLFKVGQTGTAYARDKVVTPFKNFIVDNYKNNEEGIQETLTSLFKGAGDMALGALNFGKDVMFNKIPTGFKEVAALAGTAKKQITDWLQGPVDVFIKGQLETPLLRANLMKMGFYRDAATDAVIKSIDDIKGPVIDRFNNFVLTVEDIGQGLVDRDDRPIKTAFEKLTHAAFGKLTNGLDRVKDFYKTLADGKISTRLKSMFEISGAGSDKSHDVLVEIRDILKGKAGLSAAPTETEEVETEAAPTATVDKTPRYRGGRGVNVGGLITKGTELVKGSDLFKSDASKLGSLKVSKGASLLKGVAGLKKGGVKGFLGTAIGELGSLAQGSGSMVSALGQNSASGDVEPRSDGIAPEEQTDKPSLITRVKKRVDSAKATWNDRDGSGHRDGDWRDRLNKLKEDAKNKPKALKADLTARYRSSDNVLDMIAKQASGLLSGLSKGASGIMDAAGSVLDAGLGKLGLGKGAKGVLGKMGRLMSGTFKAGKLPFQGLAKVGAPIVQGISAVKNVAAAGRLASAANTARTMLTVGSLATGGVGSVVMGAGSLAMSAVSSVLASPVALGAIAVGVTAYAGYKAYKYFTRDDVDSVYDSIRLKQYGLTNSERDQHHNHHMFQLEEYFQDGRIGYDRGKAYILSKKVDPAELLSILDIDPEDDTAVRNFTQWLDGRFKPFFLTSLTALYAVNRKSKLSKIKDLTFDEKSRYLDLVSFESGPYDVQVSPFKDIDRLSTDPALIKDMVQEAQKKIQAEIAKRPKTPMDATKVKIDKPLPLKDPNYEKNKRETPVQPLPKIDPRKPVLDSQGEDGAFKEPVRRPISPFNTVKPPPAAAGPVVSGDAATQFIKLEPGVELDRLNPTLLEKFKAMVQEYGETTGKSVLVTSGWRSTAKQEELYRKDPSKAAKPGRSLHEFGLAMDVNSTDLDGLEEAGLMRKYGFTRPVGGEPWHTEPAGIQGGPNTRDHARNDPNFASQAIEASMFRGGGGWGTMKDAPLHSRNDEVAIQLLDIKDTRYVKSDKDQVNTLLTPKTPPTDTRMEGQSDGAFKSTEPPTTTATVTRPTFGSASTGVDHGYRNNVVSFQGSGKGGYAGSITATNNSMNQGEMYGKVEFEQKPKITASPQTPVRQPKNVGEVVKVIEDAASQTGTDSKMMTAMAAVESGFNPNARAQGSSAKGLFQFLDKTWENMLYKDGRKYGLDSSTSPFDPEANSLMAAEFVKDNLSAIKQVKPEPNLTDAYMAHFLGPGGASKFLRALRTNPQASSSGLFPEAARANPGIFTPGGQRASLQQVYDGMGQKLASRAGQFGVSVPEEMVSSSMPRDSSAGVSDGGDAASSPSLLQTSPVQPQPRADTQSTAGSSYGKIADKPPASFNTTPVVSYPTAPSSGTGQGFSIGGLETGINHVGEILDKSLTVQSEMSLTLKQILAQVSSSTTPPGKEGVQPVNTTKAAAELSKPAIDLARKSA